MQPPSGPVDGENGAVFADIPGIMRPGTLVVEDHRAFIGIDNQDSMRNVFLNIVNDGNPQAVFRHAEHTQRRVFCNREVLAIPPMLKKLDRRGPVIALAPFSAAGETDCAPSSLSRFG